MKKNLLLLVLLLNVMFATSQGLFIDSLKIKLAEVPEDTSRVLLLAELGNAYLRLNPDSGLTYSLDAYKLGQQIQYLRGEAYSIIILARCWWGVGEFATAIKLLLPKISEIESLNDDYVTAYAYGALSDIYRDQGDYDKALEYDFKSIQLIKKIKGCPLCRLAFTAVASNFLGKNKPDSARYYLKTGFAYPPDPGLEGWPLFITGKTFAAYKNYDSALFYFRQSISRLKEENNDKDLADVYNNMANLFKLSGKTDSAIYYLQKSLSVTLPKKFAKETMEAFLQLSKTYEKGNTDSALHYYKLAIAAKDSLYNQEKQRQIVNFQFNELLKQQENENAEVQYRNKIRTNILLGATGIFIIIGIILLRNNRQKQKAKAKIEKAYAELKMTQAQLIQSEKMASLGELTAGIAHEIQNPLNFVNNFSEVNSELLDELEQEAKKGSLEEVKVIAKHIKDNEEKINHHGKRADAIVKSMLQHSRVSTGKKEPTDINALADEYLRLAYHGLRAKDKSFNANMKTDFDQTIKKINIVPQDIGRVLLNLFTNAFYSVAEKNKHHPENYEPTVSVSTNRLMDKVEIKVRDNGMGIQQKVMDKIFQPFFTTKPTGQGTGLGLSLSYDIITKAHGGELKVETKEEEFAEFIIILPTDK